MFTGYCGFVACMLLESVVCLLCVFIEGVTYCNGLFFLFISLFLFTVVLTKYCLFHSCFVERCLVSFHAGNF